jgi:hypothetical protein
MHKNDSYWIGQATPWSDSRCPAYEELDLAANLGLRWFRQLRKFCARHGGAPNAVLSQIASVYTPNYRETGVLVEVNVRAFKLCDGSVEVLAASSKFALGSLFRSTSELVGKLAIRIAPSIYPPGDQRSRSLASSPTDHCKRQQGQHLM